MSKVRIYCPNHGLIKEIEMDCMWLGHPPMPEIEYAFCPKCGEKTTIKRSKPYNKVYEWTDQDEKKERYRRSFGIESDENGKVTKICRDVWDY
jgi:hypothetical protein